MTTFRLVSDICTMDCTLDSSGVLTIHGSLSTDAGAIVCAANSIQRMTNYSGSALPYPSREMAMENSPNYLEVPAGQTEFSARFWYPNAYSTEDRRGLVPPAIFVKMKNATVEYRHNLPNPFPLRTLTPRHTGAGPAFFMRRQELGVRTQESILRQLSEPTPYLY